MYFSIITACLNRARTMGATMDSLATQRFVDYEHVIVDGGSSDGTLGVIAEKSDPRTRLTSGPDRGIYDALNKGLVRARGDVVGLLHSDDVFADDAVLDDVARAFSNASVDAVYGDLDYVASGPSGRVVRHWRAGPFRPCALRHGWMPPHPTLFLRRRVIDRLGGFDTSYRIAADYEAVLRYFGSAGFQASYLPRVLVRMQLGGASNRSIGQILRKSAEDYRAIRSRGIGGAGTLLAKNASKLSQFIAMGKAA
ncbi:MAG: glycosyltransferase family 2 protein [Pseudomonadota bacterium]